MLLIPLDTILFFNDTFPIVGLTNVVIILKVVDFPAPFGPNNAKT